MLRLLFEYSSQKAENKYLYEPPGYAFVIRALGKLQYGLLVEDAVTF